MATTYEVQTTSQSTDFLDDRVQPVPSIAIERETTRVPDHVPATMAAEHPDAAEVVGRRLRRKTIRVVGRGREQRSALPAFALVACVAIAAAAPGPSQAPPPSATTSHLEAQSSTHATAERPRCPTALLGPLGPGCAPRCSPLMEPSLMCVVSAPLDGTASSARSTAETTSQDHEPGGSSPHASGARTSDTGL